MEETETERLIRCHKPQFIRWTDWILDGDAVTYGGGAHLSPSACKWILHEKSGETVSIIQQKE